MSLLRLLLEGAFLAPRGLTEEELRFEQRFFRFVRALFVLFLIAL